MHAAERRLIEPFQSKVERLPEIVAGFVFMRVSLLVFHVERFIPSKRPFATPDNDQKFRVDRARVEPAGKADSAGNEPEPNSMGIVFEANDFTFQICVNLCQSPDRFFFEFSRGTVPFIIRRLTQIIEIRPPSLRTLKVCVVRPCSFGK